MAMLNIEEVTDLEVGDIGFYVIPGRVGGVISLGQWLIDLVSLLKGRATEGSWFTHAYVVTARHANGVVEILEAMPGGAQVGYLAGAMRIGPGYGYARLPLDAVQRIALTRMAGEWKGIPYSFLDYLSIALLHLGIPRRWVAGRVTGSRHMICSQLADHLISATGFKVFADGRLPQDVTPGALFHRAGAIGEVQWW